MRFLAIFLILFTISQPLMAEEVSSNNILTQINHYRVEQKLSTLKMNNFISEEARYHSNDMLTHRVSFGHSGFKDRYKKISQHFGGSHQIAENVIYFRENATPQKIAALWISSPGHRKNIVGNYTLTGIGVAEGKGVVYVTQIFLR
jgi:uncharacterized protein YkwD